MPVVCEEKVRLVGESVTAGAGVPELAPVPFRATVWGDPAALSVIVSVPARFPVAVGIKVTATVQVAPAATLVPQLLVWAKSPEAAIEVMASAAVPVLLTVTACAVLVVPVVWDAKVRLVGESVTAGAGVPELAPVPLRPTVCGDPVALSVIVNVPPRVPVPVGENVTEIEHCALAATLVPQLLV